MTARNATADWMMLLALTVMWGSAFMLTKIAVAGLPPTWVVIARLVVACVILLLVALAVARRPAGGGRLWSFYVLIALFGNALPFSLISWGQGYVDSGLAGILMAVMPLFTLGIAHFTVPGERVNASQLGGFLLGLAGVVVLMGPDVLLQFDASRGQILPMLAILAGAASYSIAAILSRLRPASDAVSSATATTSIAAFLMLPIVLYGDPLDSPIKPGGAEVAAVLLLGIFSTAIASIVYFRLITRAGPTFVSQLNYLIPLWAVAIGAMFLNESLQPNHLVALLLILGGISFSQWDRRKAAVLRQHEASARS